MQKLVTRVWAGEGRGNPRDPLISRLASGLGLTSLNCARAASAGLHAEEHQTLILVNAVLEGEGLACTHRS